jgi:phage terminase small subunit
MRAYNNESTETAEVNGHRLLSNAKIRSYIDERLQKVSDDRIASIQEIKEYLTKVLRGEIKEEITTREGDEVIDCKVAKISDRNKATEMLAKTYALFTDKLEVEAHLTISIDDVMNN